MGNVELMQDCVPEYSRIIWDRQELNKKQTIGTRGAKRVKWKEIRTAGTKKRNEVSRIESGPSYSSGLPIPFSAGIGTPQSSG